MLQQQLDTSRDPLPSFHNNTHSFTQRPDDPMFSQPDGMFEHIHEIVHDILNHALSQLSVSSLLLNDEQAEFIEDDTSPTTIQDNDSTASSIISHDEENSETFSSNLIQETTMSQFASFQQHSSHYPNLDVNIESDPYGFSSAYFCFGSNEENFLSLDSSQLLKYATGVDGFNGEVISRVTPRTFHSTPTNTENNGMMDVESTFKPRSLGGDQVVEHIRMAAYNLGILTRRVKSFHENTHHNDSDGTICYISGSNERGQFGLPEKFRGTSMFRKVDYFEKNGIVIKDMTFGSYFALFLSRDGKLYSAGENENGQLGRSSLANQFNIEHVKVVNPETNEEEWITQIEAGAFHCAYLSKSGNVYSQGYNCWGQSGHDGEDILSPSRIDIFGKGKIEIERIVCIEHNTFFITKPNPYRDIYACGFSKKGQLGKEYKEEAIRQPVKLQFFSGKDKSVKSVSGGWGHVIIATQDGSVYSQGLNDYGQCGLGDLEPRKESTLIPFFAETLYKQSYLEKIEEVKCGSYHSLFLSRSGKLFGCGYNEMGSLSLGTESWITVPTLIIEFPGYLIGEPHYQLELKTWCYTTSVLVKKRSKRVEQFFSNLMRSLEREANFFDLSVI
ncbi:hypothetical protein C9374_008070 [Naegleria lovaniensis]|uniref:RCC1-like domain-containing protein n=1 Tax=Naegleria lovaniensis TaxID=51637 RepID=A0AA88KHQ7_NAELO|nr:uncharacterized protein C9374_008070 [Naegleria lovaniensis]KAG2378431.1 hypothetical protein C9374_008070 [Naegleria lovaniensis]